MICNIHDTHFLSEHANFLIIRVHRILIEKLKLAQLVKKPPAFYEIFVHKISPLDPVLSKLIQPIPSSFFPSDFPNKILTHTYPVAKYEFRLYPSIRTRTLLAG